MRYLLDTNIISQAMKPTPSAALDAWMLRQVDEDFCISAVSLAEVRRGILAKPAGKKRDALEAWYTSGVGPPALFAGRILAFDARAAGVWARLMADGARRGRPRSPVDTFIAATAVANDATIVTLNDGDFPDVPVFNPARG